MTTEEKPKRTRRTKAEVEAASAPAAVSCDCGEKIAAMEAKIEVLAQYMKTFNIFLNQSMSTNYNMPYYLIKDNVTILNHFPYFFPKNFI